MRADVFLTEGGYAPSRGRARLMIESGTVEIDGVKITKPSQQVPKGEHEVSLTDPLIYVSRGGLKLEAALNAFGIEVKGLSALDIGASTGGFTDCLLQRGAKEVFAVDSGEGQLAKKLLQDPRVTSFEHLNARYMTLADINASAVDLIVMDVSFISATYILPRFEELLNSCGIAVCLVKPQFEVGRGMIGKGGIVNDPKAHEAAVLRVAESARSSGLTPTGLISSPVRGGDGNREFLLCLEKSPQNNRQALTEETVREVVLGSKPKGVEARC